MESTLELTKIKEVLQKNLKILIILTLLFLIISDIVK
ncbi:capsular biosynthesis protein, partial [Acinetobacter baumannii]|nr:capsular biosynthesis protein [Acinetobacter baumannii]MCW1766770.1 capsular biosynthesis protein [Acinetobacter baumannii]